MNSPNYDVVIVGAGAAGVTAAIGLARMGFAVVVVEAAAFPGAENWSGCVYFCENLVHPEILGPEGVEMLAWERRLSERGFFATDGLSLLGIKYRDREAFRNCFTVLRPIFDHHLAQIALKHGVAILNETTAESLIRDGDRIVGICTQRGPLYADLVFLAEGDASNLVTREGYERSTDPREAPKFLQGIKQVIDMPPGAIEEIFGVGAEEGVAYEMLVRNGTLHGKPVHLNMGGFIYTNRQSLSVGLVLPADNLHEHFDGDPNLLIEWFENLPALQPWLSKGRRGVFGAKIIRGGGAKDIPILIDNGLAIGGAASAIGVDFPYPNFTGPATGMGLLLAQAVRRICAEKTGFTKEALQRHYLEPLQKTHYWEDVEFLRRWPAYVKKTQVFFDRNLDLALGSAYVWSRPNRWFLGKWINWLRLAGHVLPPIEWTEIRHDFRHLSRALRLKEIADRPALGQILLDGTVNALRDICNQPRANLPAAGTVRFHYYVAGAEGQVGNPPGWMRRWFRRIAPILAAAARKVYANDDTPLRDKLPEVMQLLNRQANILDLMALGGFAVATGVCAALVSLWDRIREFYAGRRVPKPLRGFYRPYARAAQEATDLTRTAAAAQNWEARLGQLAYQTVKASHIRLLWPKDLAGKGQVVEQGLWHVCPAHVYEARVNSLGQLQIIVNFENCIKCETCWRASDLVDWGRDGQHRFIYAVRSPSVKRLVEAVQDVSTYHPEPPRALNWWETAVLEFSRHLPYGIINGTDNTWVGELRRLMTQLDRKLQEFENDLAAEPRTLDKARAEYLETAARYAQQLAEQLQELVRDCPLASSSDPDGRRAYQQLRDVSATILSKVQERSRRTWNQRYAWAAADGRQIRWHHLNGLEQFLRVLELNQVNPQPDPIRSWLKVEENAERVAEITAAWSVKLDTVFPHGAWKDLDRGASLGADAAGVVRDLLAKVPTIDPENLAATLHPPLRKAVLAELGRRDPSLAFCAASHLWARDLARVASGSAIWSEGAEQIARAESWTCFGIAESVQEGECGWKGETFFVPAMGAQSVLLLIHNQLALIPAARPGLRIMPLATLGLRGAGLARISIEGLVLPRTKTTVDRQRMRRVWAIVSAADLTAIAFGMADQLCHRAIAHATSRVQFPGLFHDEESRDTIGKFGAVKKMIAEMGARRYLIETLDQLLSPTDFSASALARAGLIKALAADCLGTAPGSLSYNAGQVFGGTGYSEDDILSKYYRDAAAWRFLGLPNTEIYRRHGQELLQNWRTDGQSLASLPVEGEWFEQVIQRKALQAELDEVRNARSRLRSLVNDWQASPADPAAHEEIAENLARQDARLLASKALVLRTHARLEDGYESATEMALIRVWLENAAVSLEEFEGIVQRCQEPAGRHEERPVVELIAGSPVTKYADYLAADCNYDSGDFLVRPANLLVPRFVPEMIEADPELARRDREIKDLLTGHFGRLRGEGLLYERYIECRHRPDEEDLEFCRKQGFFRFPIPQQLGGEGRQKIDYYLLTTNAQRLVDVAISLSIQANTSIGSTPVLLARNKDLPNAQRDLQAVLGDSALQTEMNDLKELQKWAEFRNIRRIQKSIPRLQKHLDESVFSRTHLKGMTQRFATVWKKFCRQAAGHGDAAALRSSIAAAVSGWQDFCKRAEELQEEIGRRLHACDLFLQWVSAGQISAFALTEPSAGSDTARVATRAKLRSVPLEQVADGIYRFTPAGTTEPRTFLDTERLVFRGHTAYYQTSEKTEPVIIGFDEYDYESDDAKRMRYIDVNGERIHFTDIGLIRKRSDPSGAHQGGLTSGNGSATSQQGVQLWYDYWELTGAKMWITNGRMCGIMALYAKTEDRAGGGVTGFIVDRHAEGLIVGKDEEKMGQCGSPTNELSLQAVRVPRENVLGLEGRGQVNALETLNVGRAGLAMSAMAQMKGLVESSRMFAREHYGEIPEWVRWRLQVMEELRFSAEAVANEVIGRFEHPQTKSASLESAISKMLASEALHQIIELAEEIHGFAGQTQYHLVEKRKRDARIMNIYEGTNEIQRFFILKTLTTLPPPPATLQPPSPAHMSREVLELEALKANTRRRVQVALEYFDQDLWRNPNLQANCFLLAEAAAWVKAADSSLYRLSWLSRQELATTGQLPNVDGEGGEANHDGVAGSALPDTSHDQWAHATELGHRTLARCFFEIRLRLRRFDEELTHLRRGYYAPEIRAASLLFEQEKAPVKVKSPAGSVTHTTSIAMHAVPMTSRRNLAILIVVDPLNVPVPQAFVSEGRLLEPHRCLNDADRSSLETALRLRDAATVPVTIEVIAIGPRESVAVLREVCSLGADRVRLVATDAEAVTPDSAADALAKVLGAGENFDLLLGGSGESGCEDGLIARLAAEALGIPFAGTANEVAFRCATPAWSADNGPCASDRDLAILLAGSDGKPQRVRALPAAVDIKAGLTLRAFTTGGYLSGLTKAIDVIRWPRKAKARTEFFAEVTHASAVNDSKESSHPLSPREAAQRVLSEIGLTGGQAALEPYDGPLEEAAIPSILEIGLPPGGIVIAVLAAEGEGRLQRTVEATLQSAQLLATTNRAVVKVLLVTSQQEEMQRRALAQLLELFAGDIVLVAVPALEPSPELQGRLLAEWWPDLSGRLRAVVGEPWTEEAFACLVCRRGKAGSLALRVRRMDCDADTVVLQTERGGGKLAVRQTLDPGANETAWISLAAGVEIAGRIVRAPKERSRIQRWTPRLEVFYSQRDIQLLLKELKQEIGLVRLADADFIVDVGYGVGNQDGYEAVVEPLLQTLQELGVRRLVVGGSRKVTEELHLLPADRQIGQSGVSVNPQILLAIGISGAPQHLNYIGTRATIVAFNRDPEAPIMTLNQRQPRPRVFPVVGDLFQTVPSLSAALKQDQISHESAVDTQPTAIISVTGV